MSDYIMLERIAIALENLNEKLIPILARIIGDEIKGEKLSTHDQKIMREMIPKADVIIQDVLEGENASSASHTEKLDKYVNGMRAKERVYEEASTNSMPPEDFQKLNKTPVPRKGNINWILDDKRVKYKECTFCDQLVSWNSATKNYDHFNRGFKYLYPRCDTNG